MDWPPSDWIIMVGFLGVVIVLSCVCRWQRVREDREWAQFHAPLDPDTPSHHIDILQNEAAVTSAPCAACGFHNFSTKIFCALCHTRLNAKVSETPLDPTRFSRRSARWTRKADVEGRLYWHRNTGTSDDWSDFVAHRTTDSLVLEDPSTNDPTAAFSSQWQSTQQNTKRLLDAQHQPFPNRIAEFVASPFRLSNEKPTTLCAHRETVLSESLEALALLSPSQAQGPIRVTFVGEPGIDAGGVYREWCSLLSEQLVRRDAQIFTCVDTAHQRFYLNPFNTNTLLWRGAGRFVGRALLSGDTLGFHLARPLLQILLGEPLSFHNLADFDPELFTNLQWLVNHDGVDALALDFTLSESLSNGETRAIELIPGGRGIAVTDVNKREYLELLTRHRLVHSVAEPLHAFVSGVYDVVPLEKLVLFTPDELEYMLAGSDDIDVDDWERHTRYTQDLWHHPTHQWFWEIVRAMTPHLQQRLLQFATGATRVPLVGFQGLTSYDGRVAPFTLVGRPLTDDGFVRSHACFNRLDVPLYVSKRHLERGLYALLETDVYGFSMA